MATIKSLVQWFRVQRVPISQVTLTARFDTDAEATATAEATAETAASAADAAANAAATVYATLRSQIFRRDGGRLVQQQRFAFALAGTDTVAFAVTIADLRFGVHRSVVHRRAGYLQQDAILGERVEMDTQY